MIKLLSLCSFSLLLVASEGNNLYTKYGCYGCHGIDAKGVGDYPKLANLPTSYIEKKLLEYKNGKVNSNRANIMKPFAKKLSKKDIEILAKYLHNLKNDSNEDRYYEEYDPGDSSSS